MAPNDTKPEDMSDYYTNKYAGNFVPKKDDKKTDGDGDKGGDGDDDVLKLSRKERMDALEEYMLLMMEEKKAEKKKKNDYMDYGLPKKNMT